MNLISGTGPDNAKILIASDYPTKDDLSQGIALSGKAGDLVNRLLRAHGESLDNVWRTLVFKGTTDENQLRSKKTRYKYIQEVLQASEYLDIIKNEILTVKPNVIIALGEISLNTLTDKQNIENFRGSILSLSPLLKLNGNIKVVPTWHPRQIWERYEYLPVIRTDYGKAVKRKEDTNPIKSNELLWIARNAKQLSEYWHRAQNGKFLVFDIETYFDVPQCISLCTDGNESVCVPLIDKDILPLDLALLWQGVSKILNSPIHKANQNLAFDLYKLENFGLKREDYIEAVDDTALLNNILYPELPKNLGFLTSIYTDFPYHKDEGKAYDPNLHSREQLYIYCAKDSLVTWNILEKQIEDAKELKVFDLYKNFTMKLFHTYRKHERRGLLVDEAQRQKLREKYEMIYNIRYQNITGVYGKDLNIRSYKQVGQFVYDFLKCPPHTHTTPNGGKVYSTDKETLEGIYINEISDPTRRQILQQIIVCRKVLTILDYINALVHPDGRLRSHCNIAGTKSGRTSWTTGPDRLFYLNDEEKFEIADYGVNFQSLPKRPFECEELEGEIFGADIPTMFVPSPGYVFIEGDGKAAEAGVVCVLSEDYQTYDYMYNRKSTKRNQYGCKDDIHVLTAQWTTEKEFENITQYDRETYGKRPRHAGNYDMGAFRLSQMIHKVKDLCEQVLMRFHMRSPKIRAIFHAQIQELIKNQGFIVTLHGRRRDFFGRRTNEQFREAYSYIPQAVVSDHTKETMLLLEPDFPDVFFLLEKHDSFLSEVKIEDKERFAAAFKKHYERAIDFTKGSMPRDFKLVIPAEIKWSDTNWGQMKEIEL